MVNGDGLYTLLTKFIEEFGYTALDVVNDFVAALLPAKRVAKRLEIVLQQFVSILVNLEEAAAKVDGDILLFSATG